MTLQSRVRVISRPQERVQARLQSSVAAKNAIAKGSAKPVVDPHYKSGWGVLKVFWKHLWPAERPDLRKRVVFALSLMVLAKLTTVQVPFLFKCVVDNLTEVAAVVAETGTAGVAPIGLLFAYGMARACASLFNEGRNAVFAKVTQAAIRSITVRACSTYFHLLNMDMKFHMSRETGGLSRAIDRGTRGISFVLAALLFNIVPLVMEVGLVCGIMTYSFGASYAAVTALTLAMYTVFTIRVTEWRTEQRKKMNKLDNEAGSMSIDSLINYETVKYFTTEEFERKRYDEVMGRFTNQAADVQASLAYLNFGQSFIFSAAITVVMMMASGGIAEGLLTVGDLVMINGLLFQLSIPLNFLGSVYRELRQALIDMDVLFSLGLLQPGVKESSNSAPLVKKGGEIEFQNVSFSYDPEKPILSGASFKVAPGSKVAVVGTSGGGKTTLFRLLFRFYDPSNGEIFVDGQNIKDVTLASLRESIGVVPQDLVLFNQTIRYNIGYGKPNATDEEIHEAARKAHAQISSHTQALRLFLPPFEFCDGPIRFLALSAVYDAILSMPHGFDTQVGERGLKLSGGEKQRICLARALLKDPAILLLDEATSGLDAESEMAVQRAIDDTSTERTVFMISHRLKSAQLLKAVLPDSQNADNILVFDKGQVVESGKHDELVARKGVYASLVELQDISSADTGEE